MVVLEAESGDGLADQRGVFLGVDLEHHRGPVPGLPHDRVRVRAGPERLDDKSGTQRMLPIDLGGDVVGGRETVSAAMRECPGHRR